VTYTNYYSNYPISDGWAEHIARGSLGGIDYAVPVGTPIYAPTAGWVENVQGDGSGGWYVKFTHDPGNGGLGQGWRDEFLHLSAFVNSDYYGPGDTIGYSGGAAGAPGAGSSTGPHIHWHLVNGSGVRVNPLDYATPPAPTPPPVPPTPPTPKRKKDMIFCKLNDKNSALNGKVFLVGQQFIHGVVTAQVAPLTVAYGDPVVYTTEDALVKLVVCMGVPREKLPLVVENKTWSRVNEINK